MRNQLKAIKSYFAGSHQMRYLLYTLVALVASDGLISQLLVASGLGREGNPFLRNWVGEGDFLVIKVVGALLCSLILWDIYKRLPKLAFISTGCFVAVYAGIVLWNVLVFVISQV